MISSKDIQIAMNILPDPNQWNNRVYCVPFRHNDDLQSQTISPDVPNYVWHATFHFVSRFGEWWLQRIEDRQVHYTRTQLPMNDPCCCRRRPCCC